MDRSSALRWMTLAALAALVWGCDAEYTGSADVHATTTPCDGREARCRAQLGVCEGATTTITSCEDTREVAECGAEALRRHDPRYEVEESLCDGLDNDCDGAIDEGFGLGEVCEERGGGGCRVLIRACGAGGAVVCVEDAALADGSPCEDACAVGGVCQGGACQGATPLQCDDGDACTVDRCDPAAGCVAEPLRTPACCALEIERVGGSDLSGRGRVEDLRVDGDRAYLAASRVGLHVVDVSNPSAPAPLGWVDTPGYAHRLDVSDGWVYVGDRQVADDLGGLRIIDARDPTAPRLVGRSETQQQLIVGVEARPPWVYVASFGGELRVIDASDPTAPVTVASHPIEDGQALQVIGDRAYVLESGSVGELQVFDVSDPTQPTLLGRANAFPYPHGMTVLGDLAYVSNYGYLHIFDVRGDTPRPLTQLRGDYGRRPLADGKLLHIVGSRGLRLYDADASPPALLGRQPTPEDTQGLDVQGSLVFVGVGSGPPLISNPSSGGFQTTQGGLWIYDAEDPTAPNKLVESFTPGAARDVQVAGSFAYVADLGGGLRVFDVRDPARPVQIEHIHFGALGDAIAREIVIQGDRMGVVLERGGDTPIQLYALNPSGAPTLLSEALVEGYEGRLAMDGARLYVMSRGIEYIYSRLTMLERQNGALEVLGEVDLSSSEGDVVARDGLVYVVHDKLTVLDPSDPTNPVVLGEAGRNRGSVTLGFGPDGLLYGTGLASQNNILVWDVSDPTAPTLLGESELFKGGSEEIITRDGFLFMAAGEYGVRAFDMTEPLAPREVVAAPTIGYAWGMDLVGDHVVVADGYGLLQVMKTQCAPR